jgi:hypothetical protein
MSEDRDRRTGRHADDTTPADEDVEAHVRRGGREAIDGGSDPNVGGADDEGGDDVTAHVKTK